MGFALAQFIPFLLLAIEGSDHLTNYSTATPAERITTRPLEEIPTEGPIVILDHGSGQGNGDAAGDFTMVDPNAEVEAETQSEDSQQQDGDGSSGEGNQQEIPEEGGSDVEDTPEENVPQENDQDLSPGQIEDEESDVGTESDSDTADPTVEDHGEKEEEEEEEEESPPKVAELVITKSESGVMTCKVDADPLIYTACNLSVWINEIQNKTDSDVYQTSTQIDNTDTLKCKASCSTTDGIVTMTAGHAPTNIFTMPILVLMAIGGAIVLTTFGILIYFIRKSKRKSKRGYHFPLTDNSVQAYNLEEDINPVTSGNGTQVVVSDSYNLVDG